MSQPIRLMQYTILLKLNGIIPVTIYNTNLLLYTNLLLILNRLKYSIVEGNPGCFTIDQDTGRIKTSKTLDREARESYRLTVLGQNKQNSCHKGRAVVLVNVNDINDNAPAFDRAQYSATVLEERPSGTFVAMVTATDKDTGTNAQLSYSITSGNDGNRFIIDSKGEVRTTRVLNFEDKSRYTLGIKVQDGGQPRKSDTATLTVIVQDVNEPPYFVKACANNNTCKFTVVENNNLNAQLGVIQAQDSDTSCNSLTYKITTEQSQSTKVFAISNSGQITVLSKLDREFKSYYTAVITVQDCGKPALKVSTRIQVEVLDVNDESPRFAFQSYKASVYENIAVGSTVLQVFASGESFVYSSDLTAPCFFVRLLLLCRGAHRGGLMMVSAPEYRGKQSFIVLGGRARCVVFFGRTLYAQKMKS